MPRVRQEMLNIGTEREGKMKKLKQILIIINLKTIVVTSLAVIGV
jgi:hypothetical protein